MKNCIFFIYFRVRVILVLWLELPQSPQNKLKNRHLEIGWTAGLKRSRWGSTGDRSSIHQWGESWTKSPEGRGWQTNWRMTSVERDKGNFLKAVKQPVWFLFFLASDTNTNHGINTHTCPSLLAQLQTCVCASLSAFEHHSSSPDTGPIWSGSILAMDLHK